MCARDRLISPESISSTDSISKIARRIIVLGRASKSSPRYTAIIRGLLPVSFV